MSEKERFVDKGIITIVDQGLTDTLTDKDYWVEDGLEDIVELLNSLHKENEELKDLLNTCKEGQQNLIKDGKKCNDALNKIWDILKEEIKGETDD